MWVINFVYQLLYNTTCFSCSPITMMYPINQDLMLRCHREIPQTTLLLMIRKERERDCTLSLDILLGELEVLHQKSRYVCWQICNCSNSSFTSKLVLKNVCCSSNINWSLQLPGPPESLHRVPGWGDTHCATVDAHAVECRGNVYAELNVLASPVVVWRHACCCGGALHGLNAQGCLFEVHATVQIVSYSRFIVQESAIELWRWPGLLRYGWIPWDAGCP